MKVGYLIIFALFQMWIWSNKVTKDTNDNNNDNDEVAYDGSADNEENEENEKETKKGVFDLDPKEARRLLNQLNEIANKVEELKKGQYQKLEEELKSAFLSQDVNIRSIRILQNKILEAKKSAKVSPGNLEVWDAETTFYLLMVERLSIDDINSVNRVNYGLDSAGWMNIYNKSNQFNFYQALQRFREGLDPQPSEEKRNIGIRRPAALSQTRDRRRDAGQDHGYDDGYEDDPAQFDADGEEREFDNNNENNEEFDSEY